MSAPVNAFFMPSSFGRKPSIFCDQRFSALLFGRWQNRSWFCPGTTHGRCGDVGKVGCDTGSVDNIVERELVDQRRRLEEERQRLANTAGCTCDDYTEGGCGQQLVSPFLSKVLAQHLHLVATYRLSYLRIGVLEQGPRMDCVWQMRRQTVEMTAVYMKQLKKSRREKDSSKASTNGCEQIVRRILDA